MINLNIESYRPSAIKNLLNSHDDRKRTALHYAVINCNTETVLSLTSSVECNINAQDEAGWTPLHYAV